MSGALVVAKAPVAGRVKTRLGAAVGMDRAAALAAASLLDTLAACAEAFGAENCVLALDGDLSEAVRGTEIEAALLGWTVFAQQGGSLGERLRHAHREAHRRLERSVVQVGMDTPQLTSALLRGAAAHLRTTGDAVLGEAVDGGWWLLGVGDPHLVAGLGDVLMSTPNTAESTRTMLRGAGAVVTEVDRLRDVDTVADAIAVALLATGTGFAEVWG